MSLKVWSSGEKVLASDLNGNFAIAAVFGGSGADGALNVTSGTTSIDLGGAAYFVKNYTSINISVGATVNFTNPHANGTIICLKSQGNVTIAGTLDASGIGASTSSDAYGVVTRANKGANGSGHNPGTGGAGGTAEPFLLNIAGKCIRVAPGAGGGTGDWGGNQTNGTRGAGGRGGAGLIIECVGALNFTGTINVSGANAGTATQNTYGGNGGGGGGAGGTLAIVYNILTSSAGTVTKNGGNGSAGSQGNGGSGTTDDNRGGAGGGGGANWYAGGAGGAGGSSPAAGSAGSGTGGGSAGAAGTVGGGGSAGGGGGGGGSAGESYIVQNTEF